MFNLPDTLRQSGNWAPPGNPSECDSSVVSVLASSDRGPRFDPRLPQRKLWCLNMLSLMSFAGLTLDKCIEL